ncbi:hypothetical protein K469DRAFT_580855 [Zopfia rhizophila CBS 207.26]|uniref:C2H2-type domain-containing protein n=1 Tax=Zopfia rhizophila CBS 207.26 TaxID=1314779 RepID=A0A6A6E0F0_9PEZI|nr:hypothetical protein K469DRAFT_580855 [Zopfia rhizophila CBS 207.26]
MKDGQYGIFRDDHLYNAQPDKNGEYHCPNEHVCSHKPTKLKCNYVKYVDSHLRPFKCRHISCVDVHFSSPACLLRHERAEHGMHGHGSKPHLCKFADCERSVQGNGFPRRYNLYDHMKRVHDWTSETKTSTAISKDKKESVKSIKRKYVSEGLRTFL